MKYLVHLDSIDRWIIPVEAADEGEAARMAEDIYEHSDPWCDLENEGETVIRAAKIEVQP